MDLLGSILDTMEKPPQTSTKQETLIKGSTIKFIVIFMGFLLIVFN